MTFKTIYGAAAFFTAAVLFGGTACAPRSAVENTRGIGVYPGNPQETFAPAMVPAPNTYRNVALHKAVYGSSSYDYNLTAQLLTDGIITQEHPNTLTVTTPQGEVPRTDKEKLFDNNALTGQAIVGNKGFITLHFDGADAPPAPQAMTLRGSIVDPRAPRPGAKDVAPIKGRYTLTMEASHNGLDWEVLATQQGSGLPGKVERDSYDRLGRYFTFNVSLPKGAVSQAQGHEGEPFVYYRFSMDAPGANEWFISEWEMWGAPWSNDPTLAVQDMALPLPVVPSYRFQSAWMSATGLQEWVYVDLGAEARFDKMVLHWIHPAASGKVQVSKDAKTWQTLGEVNPEGDALTPHTTTLHLKGKGRYVRLALEASLNSEPYILSEWEIWGKGGLVPQAKPLAPPQDETWSLNGGNWQLQRGSQVKESGEVIAWELYRAEDWIPATVPATVLSSYYNIGALPDPNFGDNQMQISESFFNDNFWYRTTFEVPKELYDRTLMLHFDGINWKANVWLNGVYLGPIEGGFMRGLFDVTQVLQAGENVLAVEVIKNSHPGIIKEKTRITADINGGILGADNPTFHASIGWDWIPTIRGREIGIWNDVYITAHAGGVSIEDPFVNTRLALPDTSRAEIEVAATLVNRWNMPAKGTLEVTYGPLQFSEPVELEPYQTKEITLAPAILEHPQLWWPKGYGAPHLYDVTLRFVRTDLDQPIVSHVKQFKSGVRQMSYSLENGIFDMYINGRRFIGNGGNWGFSESNLNFRGREYDIAVAYHADMNFNLIRNWVGQTGDEEFYEACDRHGVMVWQDFWLANPWDGPDPDDNLLFLSNARDYVKRIRNHASIALYVGRNEGDPPAELNSGLDALVKELHPGHFYLPNSADGPVSGRGPYRALPVKEYFELRAGRDKFHSERGMPNVMTYESLQQMLPEEHQWPQTALWGLHDYTMENAQQCATFNALIERAFGEPKDLEEFASWAQWINYDGYRAMYESRSWNRKGLLIWMSHSCWPSQVWQTYDYYFEPTAAYFACKKASAPIRIQWNPVLEKVEVVNNSAPSYTGLEAKAQVINYDGRVVHEKTVTLDSATDTTVPLMSLLTQAEGLAEVYFIQLELRHQGELLAHNFYWFGREEGNYKLLRTLPQVKVTARTQAQLANGTWTLTTTLRNETHTPALMIRLKAAGHRSGERILPAFYQDNYFALLPGEERTLVTTVAQADTRGERPIIEISGFNVQ